MEFNFAKDYGFAKDSLQLDDAQIAAAIGVHRSYLLGLLEKGQAPSPRILEAFYTLCYQKKLRLNLAQEEILKETYGKKLLFHGSKEGLQTISSSGSRQDCDFGKGFYLGESFYQAASFIAEGSLGSVYAFAFDPIDLQGASFETELDWMLSICHFRGKLQTYENHPRLKKILSAIEQADYILAPIADHKMFQVMQQFGDGEISTAEALHALSASNLGKQTILKTEKAIACLKPLGRFYLCKQEREYYEQANKERGNLIESKLKLAKREFRGQGQFIEELFA